MTFRFCARKHAPAAAAVRLQPHRTSRAEIRELWEIVDRDLADAASGGISADWQYIQSLPAPPRRVGRGVN
jgi:hypothetical protein